MPTRQIDIYIYIFEISAAVLVRQEDSAAGPHYCQEATGMYKLETHATSASPVSPASQDQHTRHCFRRGRAEKARDAERLVLARIIPLSSAI